MTKKMIGVVFGILFSLFTTLLFIIIGQMAAGGVISFWGESWLYFAVIVPFTITFAVLGGYFPNKEEITNKKLWLISLVSAFFVTLYSGTIGAIFGETIVRGGMETINVEGTLIWGTIYAFALLPLSIPFAKLIIGVFYEFITRFTHST